MKSKNLIKQVTKKSLKVGFKLIAYALLAIIIFLLCIQLPPVQTRLVGYLNDELSKKIGFNIEIGYVSLRWLDEIYLEDIQVHDQADSLLLTVEVLDADFDLLQIIRQKKEIKLDQVELTRAYFNLLRDEDDWNINILVKNIKELIKKKDSAGSMPFMVEEIKLNNCQFRMHDSRKPLIEDKFDYFHFKLDSIHVTATNLLVINDTFQINIDQLETKDLQTDLRIQKLQTQFSISQQAMKFDELDLYIGKSHLTKQVHFNYSTMQNLSNFIDSVQIEANFEMTKIHSKDLGLFANYFQKINDNYYLSGHLEGKIGKFNTDKFELRFGRHSQVGGLFKFFGLPEIDNMFVDTKIYSAKLNPEDLKPYFQKDYLSDLMVLGTVKFNGKFIGFLKDFTARGDFKTKLGDLSTDIHLKLEKDKAKSTYFGWLKTNDFKIGTFIGLPKLVQNISMDGEIDGIGLGIENARFQLNANISKFGFKNYNYKKIKTDGKFSKSFFEGQLKIDDPNLQFDANATLDLRNKKNELILQARLDTLNGQKLNLTKKEFFAKSNINANIAGFQLDSINGRIDIFNTYLEYDQRPLDINKLHITSEKSLNQRNILIDSEHLNLKINGNFMFEDLFRDSRQLWKEYALLFKNDSSQLRTYYDNKQLRDETPYRMSFSGELININPIVNLFDEQWYIGNHSKLEGEFIYGNTSIFNFYSEIDTIKYQEMMFRKNVVDLNTSKVADSTNVLAMAYIHSQAQQYSEKVDSDSLTIEVIWDKNHVDFSTYLQQKKQNHFANIFGEVDFLAPETKIHFKPSNFMVLGKYWQLERNNAIHLRKDDITIENIYLFHNNQSLLLDGTLSESDQQSLVLDVQDFDLAQLNPLTSLEFKGKIDGAASFYGNKLADLIVESEFWIDQLGINEVHLGDLFGISKWDQQNERVGLGLNLIREQKKLIDIEGFIFPKEEDNQLDLTVSFHHTDLSFLSPFLNKYISNLQGYANGSIQILGKPSYPVLLGKGEINAGSITINYLNTNYTFDGQFIFEENEIGVRNLQLRDEENNEAYLNGGIFHDGFSHFVLDLSSEFDEFTVLKTNAKHNKLYYGTAVVSGRMNMLGAMENLTISATATTESGTHIFIPVQEDGGVGTHEFIQFINRSDSVQTKYRINSEDEFKNLKLDFDLDITPDAACEIIFDIKTGDIIRGRGNGKIKLEIDTKGEFKMFGDYVFEKGGYNFTMYNLINKEFDIQPGSKISWYDDPYKAEMSIEAHYNLMASVAPIVTQNTTSSSPALTRRYPTTVKLFVEGPMLSPEFDFDIAISNYPATILVDGETYSLEAAISSFKARINSDDQELYKQAGSLLLMGQLAPDDNSGTNGSLAIGNSLSEIFSNQLSYMLGQIDENLELYVDLGAMDGDSFNTFQMRIGYTFGRLKITRDGGVQTDSDVGLIGDWTAEYLLTEDGKLRVKVYNRANYNSYNPATKTNEASMTAGFSMMYTESFDTFGELINGLRFKKKKEEEKLLNW